VHLEAFSVSNGGRELIQDATVILAAGRRYGLIGRNGTGGRRVEGLQGV
jgi:ATP-binding cassette subfamily F protein 3